MRKRLKKIISVVAPLCACAVLICWIYNEQNTSFYPEHDDWFVSYKTPPIRHGANSAEDVQTDGEHLYFLYSIKDTTIVDVYNLGGDFCYSIVIIDSQNGVSKICCAESLLYVNDKLENIYVFDGTHCKLKALYKSALWTDLNNSFQNANQTVRKQGYDFYYIDGNGNTISKIQLSPVIRRGISINYATEVIFLLIFIAAICLLSYKKKIGWKTREETESNRITKIITFQDMIDDSIERWTGHRHR